MAKNNEFSIYIDTNVLRNFCKNVDADANCLRYIFSVRRRENLFTSSFAIGQALSGVQKSKTSKNGLSKKVTLEYGKLFQQKITVIDFAAKDIDSSFEQTGEDIEDNIHYVLSQKRNCKIILTNDKSGFNIYNNINVVKPTDFSYLKKMIHH